MNIGLLGFGVVGRGVYEITEKRGDMQVKKVLCLEDIQLPDAQAVRDIRAITEDETIDTVVEVGIPNVLNISSRITSEATTAKKTHINSSKVKNSG